MKFRRFTMLLVVLLFGGSWLIWNRPVRVDMALYAPSTSIAFLEVDDLPSIGKGIVGTEAWRLLSEPAGASLNLSISQWLLPVARWTGIGSTETVVLARSQFAISLIRFDTSDVNNNSLHIKPVGTLVIETHTAQFRMRPIFDRKIEDLAHRIYGNPQLEHKSVDDVDFLEWKSVDGASRIISAYSGTVVYVGNDEEALRMCLAVRRQVQPALAGSKFLSEVRNKLGVGDSSVFGFISSDGLKSLIAATAPYTLGSSVTSTNVAAFVASSTAKLIQGIGWSARFVDGQVEDHYYCLLANGVADQLRDGISSERRSALGVANVVSHQTYSVTEYNLRDPAAAWRDLNTAIASHVDFASAVIAPKVLTSSLQSYGIDDPDAFLAAVGPQISTARIDPDSKALLVVDVLDAQTLRKLMLARLGTKLTSEMIGDAEMQVSVDHPEEAISFVGNSLLIGSPEIIRACLQSWVESKTLANKESFRRATALIDPALHTTAVTLTSDEEAARSFVSFFSSGSRSSPPPAAARLNEASRQLSYAVKVTRLTEYGFEQTSRSSFGLIGSLWVRFAF